MRLFITPELLSDCHDLYIAVLQLILNGQEASSVLSEEFKIITQLFITGQPNAGDILKLEEASGLLLALLSKVHNISTSIKSDFAAIRSTAASNPAQSIAGMQSVQSQLDAIKVDLSATSEKLASLSKIAKTWK